MGRKKRGQNIEAAKRERHFDAFGKYRDEVRIEEPNLGDVDGSAGDRARPSEPLMDGGNKEPARPEVGPTGTARNARADDNFGPRALAEGAEGPEWRRTPPGSTDHFKMRFPISDLGMLRKAVAALQRYARLGTIEEAQADIARRLGVRTYQDAARILTSRHVFLGPGQWTKAPRSSFPPSVSSKAPDAPQGPLGGDTAPQVPRRATGVRRHEVIEGMRIEALAIERSRGLAPAKALLEVARDYGFDNFDHALQLFPECDVVDEPDSVKPPAHRQRLPGR